MGNAGFIASTVPLSFGALGCSFGTESVWGSFGCRGGRIFGWSSWLSDFMASVALGFRV